MLSLKQKPGAKVPKQETTLSGLGHEIINPYHQKIPKCPHFRYVAFIDQRKAQHIRVKYWKILSCKLPDLQVESKQKELENSIKHLIAKKSFKHLKKISLQVSLFTNQNYLTKLCVSWKLDSLHMTVEPHTKVYKLLKGLLNSPLRNCFWNHDHDINEPYQAVDTRAISLFRRLKRCKLFVIVWHHWCKSIRMQLNIDSLVSCSTLDPFVQKKPLEEDEFLIHEGLVNAALCYEKLSYESDSFFQEIIVIVDLPILPNLQDLRLSWNSSSTNEEIIDPSFIKQYLQLKCLHISLESREVESLSFLSELPNLKEFYFSSKGWNMSKKAYKDFPDLNKLEKFGLRLSSSRMFQMKGVRDFILKNKNLKSLDLKLPIEDFDGIFQAKSFKLRSTLETLRIRFNEVGDADSETAKRIAQFLSKCNFVKKLDMKLYPNRSQIYPDLNEIFLISGLAKMKSLLELKLFYLDFECHLLKKVFTNLVNLTSLKLSSPFGAPPDSINLGYILDGLAKLQCLQKFEWSSRISNPAPAVLNKLSNFLISLRKLKHLEIHLSAFSNEQIRQLRSKILPKFPLSPETLIFAQDIY